MFAVLALLLAIVLVGWLVFVAFALWVVTRIGQLPANNPAALRSRGRGDDHRPLVACGGGSITHGNVSFDWIAMLAKTLADRFAFTNAGVNGDLAWNLARRMEDIVVLRPAVILVLVGSNDVMGGMSARAGRRYMVGKGLPEMPSLGFYEKHLTEVTARAIASGARVALFTLPPLGEDLDSEVNRRVVQYNGVVRAVASSHGATVLDAHASFVAILARENRRPARAWTDSMLPMLSAMAQRFALRRSYDAIAERGGMVLFTDCIHLNARAGGALAELAEAFIVGAPTEPPRSPAAA